MNAPVRIVVYLVEAIDALKFLNLIEPNVVTILRQIGADSYAEDANQAKRVKCQMDAAQKFLNRNEEKAKVITNLGLNMFALV